MTSDKSGSQPQNQAGRGFKGSYQNQMGRLWRQTLPQNRKIPVIASGLHGVIQDAGTADSLLTAGQTIKEIQDATGRYVGCLEELGLQEGWITADHVHAIGDELSMTLYGKYLQCL